jgi:hypothetical protein
MEITTEKRISTTMRISTIAAMILFATLFNLFFSFNFLPGAGKPAPKSGI